MLGKQGWKLITNPNALVSQILKARYFPRWEFLTSQLGFNPSYTWRSIQSSRSLLEKSYRIAMEQNNLEAAYSCPGISYGECVKMSYLLENSCIIEVFLFNLPVFFAGKVGYHDAAGIGIIALTMWSIWNQRNAKLWSGSCETAWNPSLQLRLYYMTGWLPETWAISGIDMVIRDSASRFIKGSTRWFSGIWEVKEVECIVLREPLNWDVLLELQNVIFDVDAEAVVDVIQSRSSDVSEFGVFIKDCLSFLADNLSFQVWFVKQQANVVAHKLARASHLFGSGVDWEEPPSFVSELLSFDVFVSH
ncbi:hypothetical protein RCOM_0703970 [Ricinus communis]|uniref:RNase H type-1 domain-containing protein n=1 Tax=Ricinus communis TaxID=3988 RepID=B9SEF6_RICCO|nr:hypothetical protein RCOM_0703970 [Ricinus communis]